MVPCLVVFINHFAIGATAAAALELLKLYERREALPNKRFQRLIRMPLYWIVTVGMICASGYFAWVFHADAPDATPAELSFSALAARSLVREGFGVAKARGALHLGEKQDGSIGDIF